MRPQGNKQTNKWSRNLIIFSKQVECSTQISSPIYYSTCLLKSFFSQNKSLLFLPYRSTRTTLSQSSLSLYLFIWSIKLAFVLLFYLITRFHQHEVWWIWSFDRYLLKLNISVKMAEATLKIRFIGFFCLHNIWRIITDFFRAQINKSISPRERAVSNCIVGIDKLLKIKIKQEIFAIIGKTQLWIILNQSKRARLGGP